MHGAQDSSFQNPAGAGPRFMDSNADGAEAGFWNCGLQMQCG